MLVLSNRLRGILGRCTAALATMAVVWPMQSAAQGEPWQFTVTPYLWVAGIKGNTDNPGSRVHFDRDFSDLFSSLSGFPVMLGGEVRKGRVALALDMIWLKVSSPIDTRNVLFNDGKGDLSTFQLSAVGFFRALDRPDVSVEIGAGFRLWSVSSKASLNAGLLPARSSKLDTTFADPIIAARFEWRVFDRWSLAAYGDAGLGVSTAVTWQALGTVNYRAADWLDVKVGWRYLFVEKKKLELEFNGPMLALSFRF